MLEGPKRKFKKLKSAASTDVIRSRVFFNTNATKQVKKLLSRPIRKENVKKGGPNGNQFRVLTRMFVKSKSSMNRQLKQGKNKESTCKKVVSDTDIGGKNGYTVTCKNRFDVLTQLQENWEGEHEDEIGEGKQKGQGTQVASSDSNGDKGHNGKTITERSGSSIDCEVKNDEDNVVKSKNDIQSMVDVKNTAHIVKATLQGSKCIRNVIVTNINDKCIDLKKCLAQQDTPLGFLSISNLKRLAIASSLKPNKVLSDKEFDPVSCHKEVKATGVHNFQKAKIQLPSKINFQLLEDMSQDYWDYQLPYFLKFGFPLDFPHEKSSCLNSTEDSHASAKNFPSHVQTYLDTEIEHKAIFGPYKDPPYGKSTHVSPFMSREKPDSDNRRIIIDLSWPLGASVNSFTTSNVYLNTVYKLQYPTIDNIISTLIKLGPGTLLYKVDLSRAFRQLRIDPIDYNLLCLKWGSKYFSDTFCPFGHRGGSTACTRLSDFFRFLMRKRNYVVYNYVDDIMGIGPESTVFDSYNYLLQLLQDLGFPISTSKLVSPQTECNCLGIMVNTVNKTLAVPEQKLAETLHKCKDIIKSQTISKKQLQSVIGSLMFIYKAVKPSRFFVNRLLEALRSVNGTKVHVGDTIKRDLTWFIEFLPLFNGVTNYDHVTIDFNETLAIDACLNRVGGVWKNNVYTCAIPEYLRANEHLSITHFEMINIIVALKTWGNSWQGKKVLLRTDNMAVVHICNKGYTRDIHLAAYVRNIWLWTSKYDIEMTVSHIQGCKNGVADLLSRWQNTSGNQETLHKLIKVPMWHNIDESYFQVNYEI